ncbi:hypothetical protein [Sulfurimonas sp.]|uniref:hypothetical protein n=1 Tax=Sulfurimonas sp. TaxID=2022749 RepID=UPI00286E97B8|nr:hypothetical protein [Sulfurimonas sp.]
MNVEITGTYLNGFPKEYKDKTSGELVQGDYVVQIQQKKTLPNGSVQMEYYDIPVDRALEKQYADKKAGDIIKVPCNIYAKAISADFATLGIGKAK